MTLIQRFLILALCALLGACTALPHPYKGKLVDDWYEGVTGSHGWYNYTMHMCKYDDGVIVNIGQQRMCP